MRRELAAGTRLLIGIALLSDCDDGPPEPSEDGASSSGDGDSGDDGSPTTNPDYVVEGGLILCGNPLDCPDSTQECRKEAGERVGYCLECETNDDCQGEEFCAMGQCAATLCVPGEQGCADENVVATCNEEGTGFVDLEVCDAGVCVVSDGAASCEMGDGGSGTGGQGVGGTMGSGGSTSSGGSPGMPGPNLITNGDFSSGTDGWDGGTPINDGQACVSWMTTIGWNGSGSGVTLESGNYTLSFSVTSSGVEVEAKVGAVSAPFEPVLLSESFTASSQTYSYDFNVGSSQPGMGLAFNVTSSGPEFCLDDVSLRKNE